MTSLEKLNRRIVELIHGLPYKKAIEKEGYIMCSGFFGEYKHYTLYKNTIGRVMQALGSGYLLHGNGDITPNISPNPECWTPPKWKFTKENGEECTTADQTEETIEKLLDLLK